MKQGVFFCLLIAGLLGCNENSIENQSTKNSTEDISDKIQQLDNDLAAINHKQLKGETVIWETGETANCPPGSGEITYYGDAGKEEKIVEKVYGNGSELLTEYYLKAGEIFLITEQSTYYPPAEDSSPVIYLVKTYIEDKKPVKIEDEQKVTNTGMQEEQIANLQRKLDYVKTLLPRKNREELLQLNCSDYNTDVF